MTRLLELTPTPRVCWSARLSRNNVLYKEGKPTPVGVRKAGGVLITTFGTRPRQRVVACSLPAVKDAGEDKDSDVASHDALVEWAGGMGAVVGGVSIGSGNFGRGLFATEVGRCKLVPGLKAPSFNSSTQ